MILDKLNEFVITATTVLAMGAFIVKKLYTRIEKAEDKVDGMEKTIVDRKYLETQLAPIRADLNLILSHLLEHRKTEGDQP